MQENSSRTSSPKRETRKRFFSKEEDMKLGFLVSKFGRDNWQEIANLLGNGFNSRQCRERYTNYLDPRWSFAPFKIEEDELLEEMVHMYGNAWSRISHSFPNRSEVSLKNRWTLIQRKHSKAMQLNSIDQPKPKKVRARKHKQEQKKEEEHVRIIQIPAKSSTRANELTVDQNQDEFYDFGFDYDLNFENVFDESFDSFNIFEF